MKFSIFFLAILLFASCTTNKFVIEEKGVFFSEKLSRRVLTKKDSLAFKSIGNPLERWQAHNIHNYNYEVSNNAYRPMTGLYMVSVRNDTITNIFKEDYTSGKFIEIARDEWKYLNYFRPFNNYNDWIELQKQKAPVR